MTNMGCNPVQNTQAFYARGGWATAEQQKAALKLKWKPGEPIRTERGPYHVKKLQALEQLVEEQLCLNHIASTTSPWNSVFVIKKKSGKWRMLTDLRKINAIIEPMGALQPGILSPSMIPQNWKVKIIDLKNCFYTIPLQESDDFAFTVPFINNEKPVS